MLIARLRLVRLAISKLWSRRKRRYRGGSYAVACESFTKRGEGYTGTVLFRGEYWRAQSAAPVMARQTVVITSRRGLLLEVATPSPPSQGVFR